MTPREKALVASSPALGLLLVSLVWNAYEYRVTLVNRCADIGIRLLARRT